MTLVQDLALTLAFALAPALGLAFGLALGLALQFDTGRIFRDMSLRSTSAKQPQG